jgi:hypothetical protein
MQVRLTISAAFYGGADGRIQADAQDRCRSLRDGIIAG